LTILSFSMMARLGRDLARQLKVERHGSEEDLGSARRPRERDWARSVKFYEDIKFVYEIQTRSRDWTISRKEEDRNAAARRPVEDRRVRGVRAEWRSEEAVTVIQGREKCG
jgi:hypothetical protein